MTNERMLYLIDKAIGNLRDNGDGYGKTPIDFMRENGVKNTDNMRIFLDSVGAYLEELRCGILSDIETEVAKKCGKSTILSEIKKRAKETYSKNAETRPQFAYADYDSEGNVYFMCNGYWLIVSETSDGMTIIPERVKKEIIKPFNYKAVMPDISMMRKMQLPPIGKLTAYLKNQKALHPKKPAMWDRIIFDGLIGVKGEWLESFMKITGATECYYGGKEGKQCFYLEGNGYKVVLMPIMVKDTDTITDFDNM